MRRIVFVWFPRWSTDRFCRNMGRIEASQQQMGQQQMGQQASTPSLKDSAPKHSLLRENPFALTHAVAGGMRIAALNEPATRAGLAPDMPLADARALCPHIMLAGADPEVDKKALTALADWLGRYTPWTAPSHKSSGAHNGDGGIFLDITGCAHLFAQKGNGEKHLLGDMMQHLEGLGLEARAGLADTPGAAWAVARYANPGQSRFHIVPPGAQQEAIASLPVAALRVDREIYQGLEAMGLKTISQLADLPRAPLTARFGTDVAHRLDQALGEDEEPICPGKPLVPYRIRKTLADPISRLEDIAEGVARLANDLGERFVLDQKGARRLVLTLYRVDGQTMRLKIGTAEVTADPAHITGLFTQKLDRLHSDFDAGFGIDVMALAATVVENKVPSQISLPVANKTPDAPGKAHPRFSRDLSALLDRLGNRLGPDHVYQMAPQASHIPERAVVKRPVMAVAQTLEPWPENREHRPEHHAGDVALAPQRPITMLARAEPIEVLAEVPDGPPKRFRWRKVSYQITKSCGPERLAPEWWRSADLTGTQSRTRDYFQVEDQNGKRFWLFRNGLYERETNNPKWYVHGVFG